jgi:hypothetical protein
MNQRLNPFRHFGLGVVANDNLPPIQDPGSVYGMKSCHPSVLLIVVAELAIFGPGVLYGQVVPTTPTKFTTRGVGDSATSGSVGIATVKPQVSTRQITHIVLGEPRQWKLVDGKSFIGKLIAFEDIVVEPQKNSASAAAPAIPTNPTVVRNGNARFLVNSKPYELPLTRLGPEERKFVEETRVALAAKK